LFTVVEGGMGNNFRPMNTRMGGGDELGEEDNKGAMELRKWLRERMMMKIRK
jgi:hypothetical protein